MFSPSYGETNKKLKTKISWDAINCFVGHQKAGSYIPEIANRYFAASIVMIGIKKTYALIDEVEKNIISDSKTHGNSIKKVGINLIYKYCSKTHKLTLPKTKLGKKIDEFAEKYNSKKQ